jgi:thioredoxin-related protein
MSRNVWIGGGLILIAALIYSFTYFRPGKASASNQDGKIVWHSWEEVQQLVKEDPKPVFVDVYTDWCGWCKKMDKGTFTDPQVVEFMNKNFHAVKFNAEQKAPATYQGQTLNYQPGGRRGVHQLAVVLLNGRLGYPSFSYLDANLNRLHVSPGYKTADVMLAELQQMANQ